MIRFVYWSQHKCHSRYLLGIYSTKFAPFFWFGFEFLLGWRVCCLSRHHQHWRVHATHMHHTDRTSHSLICFWESFELSFLFFFCSFLLLSRRTRLYFFFALLRLPLITNIKTSFTAQRISKWKTKKNYHTKHNCGRECWRLVDLYDDANERLINEWSQVHHCKYIKNILFGFIFFFYFRERRRQQQQPRRYGSDSEGKRWREKKINDKRQCRL